jgi:hypothetical protein
VVSLNPTLIVSNITGATTALSNETATNVKNNNNAESQYSTLYNKGVDLLKNESYFHPVYLL